MSDEGQVPTARLSDYQRNAIAMMAVGGLPVSEIALAVGRTPASIRRYITEDPDILRRMDQLRTRVVRDLAVHKFEMVERLRQARAVIDEGLNAPDLRLKLDTAWKVIKEAVPPQAERVEVSVSAESKQEVALGMVNLTASVTELREALAKRVGNGKDHIVEELPGPIALPKAAPEEEA